MNPSIQFTPLPRLVPLPKAPAAFGISRSGLYRLEKEGVVRLVKIGRNTYADTETVLIHIASKPSLSQAA